MRRPYLRALWAGLVPLAVLAACGDDAATGRDGPTTTASTTAPTGAPLGADAVIDPGDGGRYAPRLDPADFVDVIDNPYLPLLVGSRWVYEGDSDGRGERMPHLRVECIDIVWDPVAERRVRRVATRLIGIVLLAPSLDAAIP